MHDKHEMTNDAIAYAVGGTGFTLATLTDIASFAQQITIILSLLLVIITLGHRLFKIYKDVKQYNEEK